MNPRVVSNPNFESWLALYTKRDKLKLTFFLSLSQKMWLFMNDTKYRKIIYQIKDCEEMNWYALVLSLDDDWGERNDQSNCGSHASLWLGQIWRDSSDLRVDCDHGRLGSLGVPPICREKPRFRPNQRWKLLQYTTPTCNSWHKWRRLGRRQLKDRRFGAFWIQSLGNAAHQRWEEVNQRRIVGEGEREGLVGERAAWSATFKDLLVHLNNFLYSQSCH